MLASQRQARILQELGGSGAVRVADLVTTLGVSDMTVRRDIEALARRGLLERVHGGAVSLDQAHGLTAPAPSSDEPGFVVKSRLMLEAKAAIAAEAAQLVAPGSSIAISAGTTTMALAAELRSVQGITIVTNSIPAAQLLADTAETAGQTVVLTGGTRTPSEALVGPIAVGALRTLHVDMLFLGVHGLDERAGLTTPNLVEAETNRALIDCARTVCVTADHTKWGVVGLGTIVALDRVDILVTDTGLSRRAVDVVSEHVDKIILAEVPTPSPRTPDAAGGGCGMRTTTPSRVAH
ncbi:DeoR/GlpR family DNA-binding transcription regulator [Nostocoides jenkinsii]|uniref:Putative DeoR-family transcriptional regulator n=1 Tax=Nostocoides jenkinsii Ben 74 TaxID=1193518 RepID=A0A077MFF9_9MICO|nr:DeoR/GlpR family DNA-binding transcription regulator [Tetrasphaera jenkinsii]CCI53952.1 putative DeoR-family transcriptional regulator [Tetrasphaera jenkinsii Ben 74]